MLVNKIIDAAPPQGRFGEGAAELDGRRCMAIETYSKHMLYHFAHDKTLHIHLGLYGKFRVAKVPASLLLKIGVKHYAIITVDRGRTKTSKR